MPLSSLGKGTSLTGIRSHKHQRPFFREMSLAVLLLLVLPTSWPTSSSSSSIGLVSASKDDSYYLHGVSNPNVENYRLYWKEPRNVLQDLDQFSSVYIAFHSCFWSEVTNQEDNNDDDSDDTYEWYLGNVPDLPTSESHWGFLGLLARVSSSLHQLFRAYFRSNDQNGSSSNVHNNGADNAGNNGNHNLESDEWYLGSAPTFGANAAYSLYGVLKEDDNTSGQQRRASCTADTYINTFVTTGGVDVLIAALGAAGVPAFVAEGSASEAYGENFSKFTSTCTPQQYDGNNNNGQYDNYDMAAEDASSAYVYRYSAGSTSVGLACSGTDFVLAAFDGATCDAAQQTGVVSSLDAFHQALYSMSADGSSSCVQLYNNGDDGSDVDDNFGDYAVSLLLQASTACPYISSSASSSSAFENHPLSTCPDPHGKLQVYTQKLERATSSIDTRHHDAKRMRSWSFALTFTGLVMACTAIAALRRHHQPLSSQREHAGKDSTRNDKGDGGSLHDSVEYETSFVDDNEMDIVVKPGSSVCTNSLDVSTSGYGMSVRGIEHHEPRPTDDDVYTNPLAATVEFVHSISDIVIVTVENISSTPTVSNVSILSGEYNRESLKEDRKAGKGAKKMMKGAMTWVAKSSPRKRRIECSADNKC